MDKQYHKCHTSTGINVADAVLLNASHVVVKPMLYLRGQVTMQDVL